MWKKTKPYVISIAIALAVGGISALLTSGNMDVYSKIQQPPLAPPAILFSIVWTVLYILMGISAALVYENRSKKPDEVKSALTVYGLSLVFNFFWSIIFFNLEAYLFAFIWLLALWALIGLTIFKYYKISPLAAYLQIPYFLWVTFAGYLNLAIYIIN